MEDAPSIVGKPFPLLKEASRPPHKKPWPPSSISQASRPSGMVSEDHIDANPTMSRSCPMTEGSISRSPGEGPSRDTYLLGLVRPTPPAHLQPLSRGRARLSPCPRPSRSAAARTMRATALGISCGAAAPCVDDCTCWRHPSQGPQRRFNKEN